MKEKQREMVWDSRYHAEAVHRYYGYLSDKFSRRDRWLVWSALLLASGTATVLFTDGSQEFADLIAVFVVALNLWIVISRMSHKAITSSRIRVRCSDWLTDCKLLWANVERLDESEIEERYKKLQFEGARITSLAESELGLDQKLRDKSEKEAFDICQAQSA